MVRIATQILLGLMFSFAVLTLFARALAHFRQKRTMKGLSFLLLAAVALFLTVFSFSYAYTGIQELWR